MTLSASGIRSDDRGFTLLEVLTVLSVFIITVALAISPTVTAVRTLRIGTDRRAMATMVALARMRAAARFTRSRIYADLPGRRFRLQTWNKTANGGTGAWVAEGGDVFLHTTVAFGFGSLAGPPPDTQPALGQALPCLDDAGAAIADTACMVFNSRSIPVDSTGSPTADGALWVNNGMEVHGITVSATGLTQSWSAPLLGTSHTWSKR